MEQMTERNMKEKLNDQGLSLIELIIAIAISTIILGAAFMFIVRAERAYHMAEYGINLQMEGQILMEQIGNWVMESNRIVVSNDGTVMCLFYIPLDNKEAAEMHYPAGYAPDNKAKCRVVYMPAASSGRKRLYMQTVEDIEDAEAVIESYLAISDSQQFYESLPDPQDDVYCIGDYVRNFTALAPSGEDSSRLGSVSVTLEMQQADQSYHLTNVFSMRNGMFNQFVVSEEEASSEEAGEESSEDTPE